MRPIIFLSGTRISLDPPVSPSIAISRVDRSTPIREVEYRIKTCDFFILTDRTTQSFYQFGFARACGKRCFCLGGRLEGTTHASNWNVLAETIRRLFDERDKEKADGS